MTIIFRKTTTGLMVALAIIASGGVSADGPNPVQSEILFRTEVVENTCTVSLASSVVDFGYISRANFTGKGSVGKTQTFEIKFSDCGEHVLAAGVLFSGPGCSGTDFYYESDKEGALKNPEAQGNSTGTGIQLYSIADYEQKIMCNDYSSLLHMPPMDFIGMGYAPTGNLYPPEDGRVYPIRAEVIQTGETPPTIGKLNAAGTLMVVYF